MPARNCWVADVRYQELGLRVAKVSFWHTPNAFGTAAIPVAIGVQEKCLR